MKEQVLVPAEELANVQAMLLSLPSRVRRIQRNYLLFSVLVGYLIGVWVS